MRVAMAEELLFGDYVREEKNRRNGSQSIMRWFSSKVVEEKPDGAQAKKRGEVVRAVVRAVVRVLGSKWSRGR